MAKHSVDKMNPIFIIVILLSIVLLAGVYWHWNNYGRILEKFEETQAVDTNASATTPPVEEKKDNCIAGATLTTAADISSCFAKVWKVKCNADISGNDLARMMNGIENKGNYAFNDISNTMTRMTCDKPFVFGYLYGLTSAGEDITKVPKIKDPMKDLGLKESDQSNYYKKLEKYQNVETFEGSIISNIGDKIVSTLNNIPAFSIKESMRVHEDRQNDYDNRPEQITEKFVDAGLDQTVYVNHTKKNYDVQSPLTTFQLI